VILSILGLVLALIPSGSAVDQIGFVSNGAGVACTAHCNIVTGDTLSMAEDTVGPSPAGQISLVLGDFAVFFAVSFCIPSPSPPCSTADITSVTDSLGNLWTQQQTSGTNTIGTNPLEGMSIFTSTVTRGGAEANPAGFTVLLNCGTCGPSDQADVEFVIYQYSNAAATLSSNIVNTAVSGSATLNSPVTASASGAWVVGYLWAEGADRPCTANSSQQHTIDQFGNGGYLAGDIANVNNGVKQSFQYTCTAGSTSIILSSAEVDPAAQMVRPGVSGSTSGISLDYILRADLILGAAVILTIAVLALFARGKRAVIN